MFAWGCAAQEPTDSAAASTGTGTPFQSVQFDVSFVDAQSGDPLAGVEICAADRADVPCATSSASGAVSMRLPQKSELMLRCKSASHGPGYMTWTIGTADINAGTFGLLSSTSHKALYSFAGGKEFDKRGAITVNVYTDLVKRNERVAGATLSIMPTGSVGPVYIGENKFPDPMLKATTTGGPGLFVDVESGEVSITLAHPTLKCDPGFGWAGDGPLTLRAKIFAGGLSNVTFVCAK
jgi:hypothetical protein